MKIRPQHPADEIVSIMTRLYDNGLTTTSGGNLSVMDENGTLWISPSGVDKANLRRGDIMEVRADGSVRGPHKVSTECPFHLAIRRSRPELKAVLHAHPGALVAFSLMRRLPDLSIIPGVADLCGTIAIAKYAVPGSTRLGNYIAEQFAKGYNTVMLENHGVVIGAESLGRAYMMFEALEFCARIELNAASLGGGCRSLTQGQLMLSKEYKKYQPTLGNSAPTLEEIDARNTLAALIKRSAVHRFFTSGTGVIASRLADGSFIVTPHDDDRLLIEPADLVRVRGGQCEEGGEPSRFTGIIEMIFAAHPEIKSVAVARPPEIMGFAVGDTEFDSRLIPESYICLKEIRRYPFGTIQSNPGAIVDSINMKNPIAIIENDAVIVAGSSPLNAFDRLEVMEFGAFSIRQIKLFGGDIVRISDEEIREIEVEFNL